MKPHIKRVWTPYAGWLWGVFYRRESPKPVGLTNKWGNIIKFRLWRWFAKKSAT